MNLLALISLAKEVRCGISTVLMTTFLPHATKLEQGNVFTPVCHSVHSGGVHARGTCMYVGGMCAWGAGMHGKWGAGMHGKVGMVKGACMAKGDMCGEEFVCGKGGHAW